jgi:hypothetical protein
VYNLHNMGNISVKNHDLCEHLGRYVVQFLVI